MKAEKLGADKSEVGVVAHAIRDKRNQVILNKNLSPVRSIVVPFSKGREVSL